MAVWIFYNLLSDREWNRDLQQTLDSLLEHMKEECDSYFDKIKPHVVKVC